MLQRAKYPFAVILAGAALIAGGYYATHAVGATSPTAPVVTQTLLADEQELRAFDHFGIGLKPASNPVVSADRAVEIARERLGPVLSQQATGVTVRHGSYQALKDDGTKDIPRDVWVVTFRGLQHHAPSYGPKHSSAPRPTRSEMHVLVDAETGAYIKMFTFR